MKELYKTADPINTLEKYENDLKDLRMRIEKQEKISEKMTKIVKNIKGLHMNTQNAQNTEFNFDELDDLLADIDVIEVQKDEPKEVPSDIDPLDGPGETRIYNGVVPKSTPEELALPTEDAPDSPRSNEDDPEGTATTPMVDTTPNNLPQGMISEPDMIDYESETKSYFKDMEDAKLQMEALKEQIKDIKNTWKDAGVNTKLADSAMKHAAAMDKMDSRDREEFEKMVDVYEKATGS